MAYQTYESIREAMPHDLPFMIREALISSVVVGVRSAEDALELAAIITLRLGTLRKET